MHASFKGSRARYVCIMTNNKKSRRAGKPPKAAKPLEKRAAECLAMARQLSEFGLSSEDPGVARVLQFMDEFVQSGHSVTCTVHSELGVSLHVLLSTQPHIESWLRVSRRGGAA